MQGLVDRSLFLKENVVYRLSSEDDGYEQVVKHRSLSRSYLLNRQTSHQERSTTGIEKRSVAGPQQYKTSCNKDKDASDASVIAVTGIERCGNKETTEAAWRVLIYDCRSWTYDQVCHDSSRKRRKHPSGPGSCDHSYVDTSLPAAVEEKPANVATTCAAHVVQHTRG
ncbi:hypothetical protein MRX96_013316 [Rhipicephalus microplus]